MDFDELESILPLADFILAGLREEFRHTQGTDDPQRFLTWLIDEGHVEREACFAALARARVVLPALPATSIQPLDGERRAFALSIDSGVDVIALLDQGGSGEIMLAREADLRRTVALKRLLPETAGDREAVARFFREGQITAQLEHPNIVPVYRLLVEDAATGEGGLAYTMKLIEGRTLTELIKETRGLHDAGRALGPEHQLNTRLGHFIKVCDAIAYAHSKGVLHRDLKPSNVMVGPYGEVYVMDWGVARRMGAADDAPGGVALVEDDDALSVDATRNDRVVGTPSHMSPEQAAGGGAGLDERSDLYALGLVLFELVTLRRANPGKDSRTAWANALAGNRREVEHHAGLRVPRELVAIIEKATEEDPEDRYQDVEAPAQDVRRYLDGEATSVLPDTPIRSASRFVSRHRVGALWMMLALVMALFITVTGSLSAWMAFRTQARERQAAVAEVVGLVSERAHHIDSLFMHYEGLVRGLAAATEQALRDPDPVAGPVWFAADFASPQTAPPDLADAPRYRMSLSLAQPVVKLAPGVSLDHVALRLAQIASLRRYFRQMMGASVRGRPPPTDAELLADGVPVVWTYVGLAEGVHFAYPGKGGYPDDYDPRTRPWYRLGQDAREPRWGNPYVDTLGQGLILPCAMGLFDDADEPDGVAGAEFTFRYIIDELLVADEVPGLVEAFLLDDEGRIVVRSSQPDLGEGGAGSLDLGAFPVPEVAAAVREGRSGTEEAVLDGVRVYVVYARMDALGWTYAVVADREAVLAGR